MPGRLDIYSLVTACADLSLLAYPTRREEVPVPESFEVREWEYNNTAGLIALSEQDQAAIVAVAGSNDSGDWRQNRRLGVVNRQHVEYHGGFYEHACDVYLALHKRTREWRGFRLILTGHSLGGAAAAILGVMDAAFWPTQVVTFGTPRFLKSKNAHKYPLCSRLSRFVMPLDLVPDVPFLSVLPGIGWPAGGWAHCGSAYWLAPRKTPVTEIQFAGHVARRVKRFVSLARTSPWRWFEKLNEFHDMRQYRDLVHAAAAS